MADESGTLEFLQEKGDIFVKLSTAERKRQADLEDAIAHIQEETDRYRSMAKEAAVDVMNKNVQTPHPAYRKADGNDVGRQAMLVTKKVLNSLEAKLNKLLQHQSEIINQNKQKKLEINHMRRMRIQTEVAQAKYEQKLIEIKSKIEVSTKEASDIVAERERLVKEKEILERVNEEEQKLFTEQHEAMSDFIKRQNYALEDALMKERKMDKAPLLPEDSGKMKNERSLEDEIDMARQVSRLTEFVHNEQNSLAGIQDRVRSYELMFDQLKKMTGTNNLEDVVTSYVNHEEEMFSLYNFIQTMNTDIDRIYESKNQIKIEMKQFDRSQNDLEEQRGKVIDELSDRYQNTLDTIRELEENNRNNHEHLNQINKKISSLFFKLQCDQTETRNSSAGNQSGGLLTSGNNSVTNKSASADKKSSNAGAGRTENRIAMLMSQGVNENNVLEYLGCIEQRAVDIISAYVRMTSNLLGNGTGGRRMKSPTRRFSSSPGGLTTPANWNSAGLSVNIDDLNINDVDMSYDSGRDPLNNSSTPATSYEITPYGTYNQGGQGQDTNNNSDIKPVDLSLYKEKLLKKMSMGLPNSPNQNGQSLPQIPSSKNDLNKSKLSNSNQPVLKVK